MKNFLWAIVLLSVAALGGCGGESETPGAPTEPTVFIGHLVDYTGPTAFVGLFYGPGVADGVSWINAQGGAGGVKIDLDTVDYSYKVPQAIATYKRWLSQDGMTALQGWGTGDTEALVSFVARDEVPVWSGSYSGHLTDPTGVNPKTTKPAPYNFFYGPSYSDACRALVMWAADDAATKGIEQPRFVHVGANHPYPNAPKEACAEHATELGFDVLPPVVVSLAPGDYKAQCLTVRDAGADYLFMANLGASVVSLYNSCAAVGTEFTFMTNIWGGDYLSIEASQATEVIFPSASPFWDADVPGMELVREIKAVAGGSDETPTHHYVRGVCTAFYMKEAIAWAYANGRLDGPGIRAGMYARSDWVPEGLEGVCLPSTWTDTDHRGTTLVTINRGSYLDGAARMETIATIEVERRMEWLGY
jgi:branched-chain amino acid transport system substrate-binding protein